MRERKYNLVHQPKPTYRRKAETESEYPSTRRVDIRSGLLQVGDIPTDVDELVQHFRFAKHTTTDNCS